MANFPPPVFRGARARRPPLDEATGISLWIIVHKSKNKTLIIQFHRYLSDTVPKYHTPSPDEDPLDGVRSWAGHFAVLPRQFAFAPENESYHDFFHNLFCSHRCISCGLWQSADSLCGLPDKSSHYGLGGPEGWLGAQLIWLRSQHWPAVELEAALPVVRLSNHVVFCCQRTDFWLWYDF